MKSLSESIVRFTSIKVSIQSGIIRFFATMTLIEMNWPQGFIKIFILILQLKIVTFLFDKFKTKPSGTRISLPTNIFAFNPFTK